MVMKPLTKIKEPNNMYDSDHFEGNTSNWWLIWRQVVKVIYSCVTSLLQSIYIITAPASDLLSGRSLQSIHSWTRGSKHSTSVMVILEYYSKNYVSSTIYLTLLCRSWPHWFCLLQLHIFYHSLLPLLERRVHTSLEESLPICWSENNIFLQTEKIFRYSFKNISNILSKINK